MRGWSVLIGIVMMMIGLAEPLTAQPVARPLAPALAAKTPVAVLGDERAPTFAFRDLEHKQASLAPATAFSDRPTLRVTVPAGSKSAASVAAVWTSVAPVRKGDVALLRFYARAVSARQESGEAEIELLFQRNGTPWERSLVTRYNVGPEWTLIEVPFAMATDLAAGAGMLSLGLGGLQQTVELTRPELLDFAGRATIAELPSTRYSYPGREAGAAWRQAALQRIETLRTAPFMVRVVDARRRPVAAARVDVRLVRPKFLWGSAINGDLAMQRTPEAERYRQAFLALFDTATLDNQLKWPAWIAHRDVAIGAVDWLRAHDVRVRGHNVIWPGWKFAPAMLRDDPNRLADLPKLTDAHLRDVVGAMRGKVIAWDVVNEPLHEQDFFEGRSREAMLADWYRTARAIDPAARLTLNDYGMLNASGSPYMIRELIDLATRVRALGGPIDALGVQSHVGQQPRAPEAVLKDLDLFLPLGLPVEITEFDVNSKDEQLQADYTRDFLIAIYSHPAVDGFVQWGFWEAQHWKPDAAMYRRDWSEKPNLQVWRDLVLGAWRTHVAAASDARGRLTARGHLGRYAVTVTANGRTATRSFDLDHGGATVDIALR